MSARAKPAAAAKPRGPSELTEVSTLAAELRDTELQTARARARFEQAVRRAAAAKFQQLQIAQAAGLSRQRIAQVLAKGGA